MENRPFYYPPKYAFECMKEDRKSLFKNIGSDHDCLSDPYYPERNNIFREISNEYDTNQYSIDKKLAWKNAMQNVYRKQQIKTPYNFYNDFVAGINEILNNTKNDSAIPIILYKYVNDVYNKHFVPDPFYSFFSILDFSLFELMRGKHETEERDGYDLNVSDENLCRFIKLLIKNGFIGITQFRFLLYFSILYRNNILPNLIILVYEMRSPLLEIVGKKMIDLKMHHRLLLIDALEFAYTQWKFPMVEMIIEKLNVPLNTINEKIRRGLTREKIKNLKYNFTDYERMVIDKYYSN